MALPTATSQKLHSHISSLLAFYTSARVRDDDHGGYHNQLRDDGTVYDANTKHVVGTCRYAVNYAIAARLFPDEAALYRNLCAHGIRFLLDKQADVEHGGFHWVIAAPSNEVVDGAKYCYSVAFALLALANAKLAGVVEVDVDGALDSVLALAESYYEPAHGLYIDSFDRTLTKPSPYRGQNANMHMCEGYIALYEARVEPAHLVRAASIAKRLTIDLCGGQGWVIEHYTSEWLADPDKNVHAEPSTEEYIFRPPGAQPGHAAEWAKLLLLLERHCRVAAPHPELQAVGWAWMLPRAKELFGLAVGEGWDATKGGLVYLVSGGKVTDGNKYYWALAEAIAAAGLLMVRCAEDAATSEASAEYRVWLDKLWQYADAHFIDGEHGGWFPMLNAENVRTDLHASPDHVGLPVKCYPSKTDYHPLAACWEVLRAIEPEGRWG